MNIAFWTALLVGGTLVRIPLEKEGDAKKLLEKVRALEFEVLSCCGKDFNEKWRYDACVHCGKELKPERKKAEFRASIRDGALEIVAGGDFEKVVFVRLSDLERCVDAAGYRSKRGDLQGPFALHVEDAGKVLAAIRKIDGVKSAEAHGNVIYVNQGVRDETRVSYAEIEKVGDISWVINQCCGYVGFAK